MISLLVLILAVLLILMNRKKDDNSKDLLQVSGNLTQQIQEIRKEVSQNAQCDWIAGGLSGAKGHP